MKKNTLIEIGTISDGIEYWTAYAEHLTFDKHYEEVTVEGIELELHSTDGQLLTTLRCPSLSEMPSRFLQRQVNALEAHILEEKRIEMQAYHQDLYHDLKRGDV